ncbi:hypothetical protein QFW80_03040 [Luteimonas sp. M1R5S18]|uniref:Beta-barrel assembly machine subunit BamC n=1 Tax=Luteimonas rhizosphaericola TaxID=3042024 RepID=A0ABT6JFM6_9GAMM|nr:hypothetical protein [Luteimonas rhizosphaericola]MDH5829493.1 hypothetical protein [Luteimonas rhizosphaericola]
MRHSRPLIRVLAICLVAAAVVGTSGCKWFRKGSELYTASPESRPLEVPPDLDRPDTSGAMQLPEFATGSVTRSAMPAAGSAQPNGFAVAGEVDAVFVRVGEVLAATEGLTVVNRAQLLGTYDVDYGDAKFLIRVTRTDTGAYVAAVDPRGLPAAGEPPQRLIAALRAALAGG